MTLTRLVSLVMVLSACTGKDVVARVGARELERGDLTEHRRLTGAPALSNEAALEQVIQRELLANDALAGGLDQTPEVKARLRAATREILARAALARAADAITETTALEVWKKDPARFEVRSVEVAQLSFLVPPQATSQDLEAARSRATAAWARLSGGEDFAEVARKSSEDAPTAARGGVLGRVREGELAQPIFEVLFSLGEGKFTQPIQGPSGFHVFKALTAPSTERPPFETIKGRLVAQLRAEAEASLRKRLEHSTTVRRYPEHLVEVGQ